jgi:hypothetical protein
MLFNPESGCIGPPHTSVTTPESRNGPEAADILGGMPLRVQQFIKTGRLVAENISNFFLFSFGSFRYALPVPQAVRERGICLERTS